MSVMSSRHVIVDGSNLATEGRSMPSLGQLDHAVREFIAENPADDVTVVVDASFGHRIDPSELPLFEEAEAAGEVISPPAGAIGRGDAFLLRIAEKTGATVLSNDSFQEFHVDHSWLFDKGRLIGGKPVPGVGWIFMERTPVRGPKSREVTKEAKRRKKADGDRAATGGTRQAADGTGPRSRQRPKAVDRAIARATAEVVEPKTARKSRRRRGGQPPSEPVNEPLAFITFIAAHPLGSEVVGSAVEYSSHGAFVEADGARCYIPLSAMAEPPPRRAREVVAKGEEMTFVVQAFDPPRRGIELALPGFARPSGAPTAETVDAEIHQVAGRGATARHKSPRKSAALPKEPAVAAVSTVAGEPAGAIARPSRTRAKAALAEPSLIDAAPALPDGTAAGAGALPSGTTVNKRRTATSRKATAAPAGRVAPAAGEPAAAPAGETRAPVGVRSAAAKAKKAAPADTTPVEAMSGKQPNEIAAPGEAGEHPETAKVAGTPRSSRAKAAVSPGESPAKAVKVPAKVPAKAAKVPAKAVKAPAKAAKVPAKAAKVSAKLAKAPVAQVPAPARAVKRPASKASTPEAPSAVQSPASEVTKASRVPAAKSSKAATRASGSGVSRSPVAGVPSEKAPGDGDGRAAPGVPRRARPAAASQPDETAKTVPPARKARASRVQPAGGVGGATAKPANALVDLPDGAQGPQEKAPSASRPRSRARSTAGT
jgi:hypothetical protein